MVLSDSDKYQGLIPAFHHATCFVERADFDPEHVKSLIVFSGIDGIEPQDVESLNKLFNLSGSVDAPVGKVRAEKKGPQSKKGRKRVKEEDAEEIQIKKEDTSGHHVHASAWDASKFESLGIPKNDSKKYAELFSSGKTISSLERCVCLTSLLFFFK
jgi:hypothetical protein